MCFIYGENIVDGDMFLFVCWGLGGVLVFKFVVEGFYVIVMMCFEKNVDVFGDVFRD